MNGIAIHLLIALTLLPVILLAAAIYARRKFKIRFGMVALGALAFFLAVNILERMLHFLVLRPAANGSIALIQQHPWLYALYGVFTAAIFEESARWLVFKWVQKRRELVRSDGLAYGLGHGGMEMLLTGVAILYLYLMVYLAPPESREKIPFMIIAQAETLSATAIYWMVLERVFALGAQIVLSYYVLYAVADRNIRFYFYAILLHAMLDLPTVLVQTGFLEEGWISGMLVVELAVLPVLFIFFDQSVFRKGKYCSEGALGWKAQYFLKLKEMCFLICSNDTHLDCDTECSHPCRANCQSKCNISIKILFIRFLPLQTAANHASNGIGFPGHQCAPAGRFDSSCPTGSCRAWGRPCAGKSCACCRISPAPDWRCRFHREALLRSSSHRIYVFPFGWRKMAIGAHFVVSCKVLKFFAVSLMSVFFVALALEIVNSP